MYTKNVAAFFAVWVMAFVWLFPHTALAQIGIIPPDTCSALGLTSCPTGILSYVNIILNIINYVLLFVGVLALLFFIVAGVRYIVSRGDEDETRKAKAMLFYTVIGLMAVGFAGAVVNFVILALQFA
jgi:hypothetical protein